MRRIVTPFSASKVGRNTAPVGFLSWTYTDFLNMQGRRLYLVLILSVKSVLFELYTCGTKSFSYQIISVSINYLPYKYN